MKRRFFLSVVLLAGFAGQGCRKCYTCTVQTDFGPVEREVCGRKSDVQGLINALESDTSGSGPWQCEQ